MRTMSKNTRCHLMNDGTISQIKDRTSQLPSGYQRLKWIQPQHLANQYIATSITPTSNYSIEFQFSDMASDYNQCFWCARANTNVSTYTMFCLPAIYNGRYLRSDNNSGQVQVSGIELDEGLYTITRRKNKVYVNNTLYIVHDSGSFTAGGKLVFFSSYIDSAFDNVAHYKCYGIKVWDGSDVLILHLLPCLRNSDGRPGLYDIINQTFYTNTGTAFLYGCPLR